MGKLFDDFWSMVSSRTGSAMTRAVTWREHHEKLRADEYRRNNQWLKEFDSQWELMFNEPGPFYGPDGKRLPLSLDFATVTPYIIRMVTEIARRQK